MKKKLWAFEYEDYYGNLLGVFKATHEEVAKMRDKTAYFGDALGKYSDVAVYDVGCCCRMISDNPVVVDAIPEMGYNPMEYVREDEEEDD